MKKFGVILSGKVDHTAQLAYSNHPDLCSDSSNRMTSLAGSRFKTEEEHLNIKMVTALLFLMPAHYLFKWKYVHENNELKIQPIGMATLKKIKILFYFQSSQQWPNMLSQFGARLYHLV